MNTYNIKQLIEEADTLVSKTHSRLGGALPVDIVKLIESFDINIVCSKDFDDDLAGLMKRFGKSGTPVIAVNANHVEERQRFTMAHELGHFLLHSSEVLHVDGGAVYYRRQKESPGFDWKEVQANHFAAALLMPKKELLKDLAKLSTFALFNGGDAGEHIPTLARKYGVSTQAMSIRIGKLLVG